MSTSRVFTAGTGLIGQQAQSVTPVTVSGSAISSVDFGFNFDTIVNNKDSGQGSFRQFITNSNLLGGEASLAQSGNTVNATGAAVALTSGKETSIFMMSDAAAHNGR
ncbi:MAG: hypothetical protein EOO88_39600 [Pedobacter sp.]|nr:MAG: hypothetical protein EOO88_39600 [Pedobacter sp.]